MAIFSDGFESGDFSAWTGVSGVPTVEHAPVHHDLHAMKCAYTSGWATIGCYEEIGATHALVYTRFYFQLSAVSATLNCIVGGLQQPDYGNLYKIHINNAKMQLEEMKPAGRTVDYNYAFAANTWYCLEVMYSKAVSGGWRVYLDGVEVITDVGIDTSGYTMYRADYGRSDGGATYNSFIDCVVINDSYVGPEVSGPTVKKGSNLANTMTTMLNSKMLFSACNRFPKVLPRRF